jgi:hypothetical protein
VLQIKESYSGESGSKLEAIVEQFRSKTLTNHKEHEDHEEKLTTKLPALRVLRG